jgi:hypothetical protein
MARVARALNLPEKLEHPDATKRQLLYDQQQQRTPNLYMLDMRMRLAYNRPPSQQ